MKLHRQTVVSVFTLFNIIIWITDLSFQSAQKAISSDESPVAQLEVLKDISQNFPSLASTLAKVSVKSDLRSSIQTTQSVSVSS